MTANEIVPTVEVLEELVERHGPIVVPVTRRLSADLLTPVAAFLSLRRSSRYCFLLESVEGGEKVARYSFIGRNPYLTIRSVDDGVVVTREGSPPEHFEGGRVRYGTPT
jgi:anthranilate synthase component 1